MIAFISYCQRDLALVEPLVLQLGELGCDVQFERKMAGAQIRWPHVLESIKTADVFVFTVTPTSILSYSRGIEVRYAQALGKPILAALMNDVYEEIPSVFTPTLDYRPSNPRANAELVEAMNALFGQVSPPPEDVELPDWLVPLWKLRTFITGQRIKSRNQAVVLLNLSEMLERQETFSAGESLLELYARRSDLDPAVRTGVQEIIDGIQQGYRSQSRARWVNATIAAVLLSFVVAVVIFFLSRSLLGRQPITATQLAESSAIVPVDADGSEVLAALSESTEEALTPLSETPTLTATFTATEPTSTLTATNLPPSATPLPPTQAATFTATLLRIIIVTSTPEPMTPTLTPTRTPIPPTATPTSTRTPTPDLSLIFGNDIYVGIIVTDTAQGVQVVAVGPTAAAAGAKVGDYVVAVDLEPIENAAEFQQEMNRRDPFARVDIRLRRGNLFSALMTLGFADYIIPTATTAA